mmetsp:Transcript_255/g.942  ORF Transcript_255/g.942 Transcript_255/m.942 type:complete len:205 (+) Transcript_255:67-681(+)
MCLQSCPPLRQLPTALPRNKCGWSTLAVRRQSGAGGGVERPRLGAIGVLDDSRRVDGRLRFREDLIELRELRGDDDHVGLVVVRAIRLQADGLDHDAGHLGDLRVIGGHRSVVNVASVELGLGVTRRHRLELRLVHLAGETEVAREHANHHRGSGGLHGLIGRKVLDGWHGEQPPAHAEGHLGKGEVARGADAATLTREAVRRA